MTATLDHESTRRVLSGNKRKQRKRKQRRNSFKKTPPIRKWVSPRAEAKNMPPVLAFMQGTDGVTRRLLTKPEMLARVRVTYPTIWKWMREGTFPRSRIVGNKSMWFE